MYLISILVNECVVCAIDILTLRYEIVCRYFEIMFWLLVTPKQLKRLFVFSLDVLFEKK